MIRGVYNRRDCYFFTTEITGHAESFSVREKNLSALIIPEGGCVLRGEK